ncbi:hypothetical protein EV122DRAFT_186896, partial [Schizophyllum commune]
QASAQGDHMRANAGGQTTVSSRNDVKLRRSRNAEGHAPQFLYCEAARRTSRSSSPAAVGVALSSAPTDGHVARGSGLLKGLEVASSTPPSSSPAYVSPGPSRSSSCEMKAQNLRYIDDRAVQKVEARSSSTSRGRIISPSRDDAEATAPPAPPLTARAIRPSGTRAAEAVNSDEYITKDCEQRRVLGFRMSGGVSAVDKEEVEGITCGSSANGHDLTSVALPRQSGEKAASADASIHAQAMVVMRTRVSSHSSREDEKQSPRSAKARRDHGENPEQLPHLNGQNRAVQASAESLSPLSSTAPRRQTICEPPDKTTSNSSNLHSCEPPLHWRSSTVSLSAPLLRSSHQSPSGHGPDSANWRARGRPTASLPWKVDTLDAGSESKSFSERERALEFFNLQEDVDIESLKARGDEESSPQAANSDRDVANCHRPRLEASTQAPAQGHLHVYAGGQVLASPRRDGKPGSSRGAGKCLPRNAKSDPTATVPDDSVRARATVEPRAEIGSHNPRDTVERSPPSAERDGNDELVQLPDSGHVSRPSADRPSTSSILGARKPPDKTSDRSSANSCQPARHRCPASVLFAGSLGLSPRRLRYASGPGTADWRVRMPLVALSLHDMDTPDPDRQMSVPSRNDLSSYSTRARKWYSPRLDATDTTAPSAVRLHFHAFECGLISEPPKDSASDLKRVHAGGQTVLSSCKDVKSLDAREGKKDPPQFIASDFEGQYLPSSNLNLATPSTCGRGD